MVGDDYDVTYSNNVGTGAATVVAVGKGAHAGDTARATFNILGREGFVAEGVWGTSSWTMDSWGTLTVHPGAIAQHATALRMFHDPSMDIGLISDQPIWSGRENDVRQIVFLEPAVPV